ncbi:MAG: TIGR03842 family LLM class F420-dependent oxidoreductase, partial [Acidobacteria bacterium]|nr:TIGR03842 family LLM class F420-dependent oxidoreductase [Acidobacteriota bacterium]
YDPKDLPESLTSYVRDRGGYDYLHHCEVGSSNADFVTDEVVDRFCILGNAEQHRRKLERLRRAGVTQFNIYLMCGEEEQTLDQYRREIIPHFRKTAAGA